MNSLCSSVNSIRTYEVMAAFFPDVRLQRDGTSRFKGLCIFHQEDSGSFTIYPKRFKCFGCGAGGTNIDLLLKAELASAPLDAARLLAERFGLPLETKRGHRRKRPSLNSKRIVAVYPYQSDSGELLYEKVRYEPKTFRLRRPDGNGGFLYNLNEVKPVLYNLPEVLKARPVLFLEGEKDVETARALGGVATTSGAVGSWLSEYAETLRGKEVTIITDADEPGRKHARQVAVDLVGVAESVRLLELPDAKDLSEWAERGGTKDAMLQLLKAAPVLTAADVDAWKKKEAQEPSGATEEAVPKEKPAKRSQADRLVALASTEEVECVSHRRGGIPRNSSRESAPANLAHQIHGIREVVEVEILRAHQKSSQRPSISRRRQHPFSKSYL